jgi:hypothetical protein
VLASATIAAATAQVFENFTPFLFENYRFPLQIAKFEPKSKKLTKIDINQHRGAEAVFRGRLGCQEIRHFFCAVTLASHIRAPSPSFDRRL